jgi:hypothetical protein
MTYRLQQKARGRHLKCYTKADDVDSWPNLMMSFPMGGYSKEEIAIKDIYFFFLFKT